nr:hypothetical protein [Tanacetum cinerariifolium]
MSSDSHATITYTSTSSYEVIVNRTRDPEYLSPADDVLLAEEQPLPAAVSPTAESPGYIMESKPEMEPEEEDGDDEKSKDDSIEYPTSGGDDDADDDGDDLSEDDADDEDEEESSDKPFEEGEPAVTPPPFGYRVAIRISVQPHILMPCHSESEVERLLAIPTPPLSPVSPTLYPLPPFLMPLPIFTPLPTSSFLLPLSLPSTSDNESIPEVNISLQKRARFTTPTGRYEVDESSIAAAARQIWPALTIADRRRADDRLIGRLKRERRYFRTLSTTYAQEVAHSCDYCTQIMDYCLSREVHTDTLVTQMEALQRDVSSLQRQHIDDEDRLTRHIQHKHAQRDALINQGVVAAMAEAKASKVRNGYGRNGVALTWWNSHVKTITLEVAQALSWKTLKKMMTEKVEKYIGGVPDTIHDSVKATKPKTMQEAIEFATELMDKRIRDAVENKRKFEGNSRNNQNQP